MGQNEIRQFINEDIVKINSHPKVQKKGTVGSILGHGTYGFVCEWKDNSGTQQAVKILDPVYVAKRNAASATQLKRILSSSIYLHADQGTQDTFSPIAIDETYASEKLAGTKNKHLMTILDGSQSLQLDNRYVQLIVMPRLKTIEQLPISDSPEHQIVDILTQCCEGLHALHEEPKVLGNTAIGLDALIHNDLKPDNIFVTSQHSGSHSTVWYIIGDYSACLNLKKLKEFYPGAAYPNELRQNPYCAPGTIGITSDIWSLGWILWYWMNGKEHPRRADIESRATRAGTRKPKNWGDNPELWEVFLKMTEYDPSHRYQTVDILQSELHKALLARDKRLAQKQESDSNFSSKLTSFGIGALGAALALYIFSGSQDSASSERTDEKSLLHGNISKSYPYLEGSFRGEWQHGHPVKGEFAYNGITKKGSWAVRENYIVPFSHFGHMTFSGLICTNTNDDFYQGVAEIHWNCGTTLKAELRNGAIHNGIMTCRDGTVHSGAWETRENSEFLGIFCGEDNQLHGCGVVYLPGNVYYEGEVKYGMPTSGNLVFPNRRIPTEDPAFENAWNLLMEMRQFHGSFAGNWSSDGYPEQGTYTFSNGKTVSGNFSFSRTEDYTGMLQNGRACGIGSHPLPEYMARAGEFLNGSCCGNITVKHSCGAQFFGQWKENQTLEGTMYFTDGTNKFSRNWTWDETTLRGGNILRGLFCDHHKKACGIGTVLFPSKQMEFRGEVLNNEIKNGARFDTDGNPLD